MVGFDLDGVLVPDCDKIPTIGGLAEFYDLTTYMIPIFRPAGQFVIITARRAEFKPVTERWCSKYLNPMPVELYHDCTEQAPWQYKTEILNKRPDITLYVESDPDIVKRLRNTVTTGCRIAHFAEYLQSEFV